MPDSQGLPRSDGVHHPATEAQGYIPLIAALATAVGVYLMPAEAAWSFPVMLPLMFAASLAVVLGDVGKAHYSYAAGAHLLAALIVGTTIAMVALQSTSRVEARRGVPPLLGRIERITGTLREDLGARDDSPALRSSTIETSRGSYELVRNLEVAVPSVPRDRPRRPLPAGTKVHTEIVDDGAPGNSGAGRSVFFTARALATDPGDVSALRGRIREEVRELARRFDLKLLAPLFIGERDGLNAELEGAFRRAGAMHVLALSGMHVALLTAFVYAVMRPFGSWRVSLPAVVVFVLLFLWLAGPRPSLLRAVLLTLLAATARASRRRTSPLNLTALAFLGMVLWNPSAIYSLSFQLSFAALIGILLAAPALSFALDGRLPRAVRLPLAAGLGAQFATAPLLAATFGIVHPIGVVATLVLAPVITLYLWAGLAAGLLHFLHVDLASHGILRVLGDLEVFIGRLVDAAGVVPGVRLSGPGTWTAMILILLAFWLSIAELRRRQAWSRLLRESDLRVLRGTVTVRSAGVARSAAP